MMPRPMIALPLALLPLIAWPQSAPAADPPADQSQPNRLTGLSDGLTDGSADSQAGGSAADPAHLRGPVADLALARDLLALGQAQGDALLVLAAAKLVAGVTITPGDAAGKSLSAGGAAPSDQGTKGPAPEAVQAEGAAADHLPFADAAALFALARSLAGDDSLMIEVIEDAEAAATRGRMGGAVYYEADLAPGRSDSWDIAFTGRALAEVEIAALSGTALDILITDANGNVICAREGAAVPAYCDFIPAWDGMFHVTISNSDAEAGRYTLFTN